MENTFKFRCSDDILDKLDVVAEKLKTSKSEVIRKGIELQYKKIRRV